MSATQKTISPIDNSVYVERPYNTPAEVAATLKRAVAAQREGLRVVASLQLGAKERAVVVEVGGQQLLLGVTPAGICRLHELPQPLPPVEAPKLPNLKDLPNFAQLLSQRLRKDA